MPFDCFHDVGFGHAYPDRRNMTGRQVAQDRPFPPALLDRPGIADSGHCDWRGTNAALDVEPFDQDT
jgi:hypothetical protein